MKLFDNNKKRTAVVGILILIGILGVYLIYGLVTQQMNGIPGNDKPKNETLFRCFIIEYNQSFTEDALVFHLIDENLEEYPEYRRGMEAASTSTAEWRDGKRLVYEVQDYSEKHLWSFNLCLEEYSRSECLSHLKLYEYQGRYFEIRCIPWYVGPK
jgi:hypothetical protein